MNVETAAHGTITAVKARFRPGHYINPVRRPTGDTPSHGMWMLGEIITQDMKPDRANRWLGYAQAIFVMYNLLTLEEVKQINKAA